MWRPPLPVKSSAAAPPNDRGQFQRLEHLMRRLHKSIILEALKSRPSEGTDYLPAGLGVWKKRSRRARGSCRIKGHLACSARPTVTANLTQESSEYAEEWTDAPTPSHSSHRSGVRAATGHVSFSDGGSGCEPTCHSLRRR